MRRATPAPVEAAAARRLNALEAGRVEEGDFLAEHWEQILSATAKAVAEAEAAAAGAEQKGSSRMLPSLSKWMGGNAATAGGVGPSSNVFVRHGSLGGGTTIGGGTTTSGGGGGAIGSGGSSRGAGRLVGGLPPPEFTRELDVGSWMEE